MARAQAERGFVRRASTVRYFFVSTTLWLPSSLLSLIPLAPPVTPFLFSPLLEARTAPRDSTPPLGTALCRFSMAPLRFTKKPVHCATALNTRCHQSRLQTPCKRASANTGGGLPFALTLKKSASSSCFSRCSPPPSTIAISISSSIWRARRQRSSFPSPFSPHLVFVVDATPAASATKVHCLANRLHHAPSSMSKLFPMII